MDFKLGHSLSEDIPFYLVPDPDNGDTVVEGNSIPLLR
jgi:hypothetical protein